MAGPRTVHEAVRRVQHGSVARMVRAGYPVDERDAQGWTPLMVAALRGDAEMVQLLLRLGADPNADVKAVTPLAQAAHAGNLAELEALVAGGAYVGRFGSAALASAIRKQQLAAAHWLLEHGAHGEWINDDGDSLLDLALRWAGLPELVGPLLRAGARPDGNTDYPPLTYAIFKGWPEVIDLLLEAGARPDYSEAEGRRSPLVWAAEYGPLGLLQRLVDRGARVDSRLVRGAASAGNLEVLRWLAGQRADLAAPDEAGWNARSLARSYTEDEAEAWLAERGVPLQPELEPEVQQSRAMVLQQRAEEARRAAEAEAARQALLAGGARPGKVIDGPFASFTGLATVLPSGEVQAQVTIFGRSTPVKLRPEQWRFDP